MQENPLVVANWKKATKPQKNKTTIVHQASINLSGMFN